MQIPKNFTEQVAMKFRLYSGLFFDLPFDYVQSAGTILPLFTQYCKDELEKGERPDKLVTAFFRERLGITDWDAIRDRLFAFIRLCERQIVLFDAVEDASFHHTREMDGHGSLREALGFIEEGQLTSNVRDLLDTFGVRIVLTAHPTQFYTEQVLGIIADLREAIRTDDVQEVNRLLLQLGRTRFRKQEKPKPIDEARAILWFMEHVLYGVLPEVQAKVLDAAGISGEERFSRKAGVELGFWPGGDRDGNPNVDAATTKKVGELLWSTIIKLYIRDIDSLCKRLTFDGVFDGLGAVRGRLESSLRGSDPGSSYLAYRSAHELLEDLSAVRTVLIDRHASLFIEDLEGLMLKVRCFGFHFGSLDLRQDSRIIARAVEEVLFTIEGRARNYTGLGQEERMALLQGVNEARVSGKIQTVLAAMEDPVLRDCLEVFSAAASIQARNGVQAVHRFIVSNTNGPADLMGVRLLALCAGFSPEELPFDLVPLFETVDDLQDAGKTMETLMTDPVYRGHLGRRNGVQHIMLGFSDGTKDGGYLSANWGIYRAKQTLSSLATAQGLQVVFFDGRGGPPARGGGNTHKFYRSLGRDIEGRTIHLTIQGQTISSTYGHVNSARYNLEQLVTAVLDNNLYPQNEDWHLDDKESALLDELSDLAHDHYLALREHPEFLPYLEHLSPLRYYASANNSSRPAKRPGSGKLQLGDLRAIPFVGAWSQLKQNIPGYYGLGHALGRLKEAGRIDEVKDLCSGSLYFRTLLENSMQSLSKVYLGLTAWAKDDKRFGPFHELICQEAERTVALILEVTGQPSLLALDPLNKASIRMREDLIIPMSVLQQYALINLRRLADGTEGRTSAKADLALPGPDETSCLEKIVVKTMATCVNASRNSV